MKRHVGAADPAIFTISYRIEVNLAQTVAHDRPSDIGGKVVSVPRPRVIGVAMRDQRAVSAGVMALVMIGVAGCIFAPLASIWLWIAILGLGQGGSFAMGLTLIAVRARDADTAADLSAMAQGVGYMLAAAGPLLVGLLHEAFGGWRAVGVALCLIAAASMILGTRMPLKSPSSVRTRAPPLRCSSVGLGSPRGRSDPPTLLQLA